jgi:hypothetical protein
MKAVKPDHGSSSWADSSGLIIRRSWVRAWLRRCRVSPPRGLDTADGGEHGGAPGRGRATCPTQTINGYVIATAGDTLYGRLSGFFYGCRPSGRFPSRGEEQGLSRTVIRGGLVVTAADEVEADVLVEDEKIAAVAARGSAAAGWATDQVIDATGKYVIPGGVDTHTHMGFGPGPDDYDDDGNVSRSPAFGGPKAVHGRLP